MSTDDTDVQAESVHREGEAWESTLVGIDFGKAGESCIVISSAPNSPFKLRFLKQLEEQHNEETGPRFTFFHWNTDDMWTDDHPVREEAEDGGVVGQPSGHELGDNRHDGGAAGGS